MMAIWTLGAISCKKDTTSPDCQTENMSFANDVMPIMNQSCNTSNCHDKITVAAGIRLDTFPTIRDNADKIVQAINHAAGVKPMPYPSGADKLSDCDINKIEAWVNQGKKNN